MTQHELRLEIAALRHAVPYLRLFRGKTFVIKAGGDAFAEEGRARALLEQVEMLHQLSIKIVLVHGGGPQTTALAAALGGEARFVAGRRVTDEKALAASVMMLNGAVNTRLLALCRELKLPAVGLSGVDGGLIRAARRPPVEVDGELVDYGLVGDVTGVDATLLTPLLAQGFVPVVSPLSASDDGTLLNVNADTVASALAVALGAEKLILVTGAPGILANPADPATLVSYTDLEGLAELSRAGALTGGMRPKAEAIEKALRGGVRRAHVIAHGIADSLLVELFTNEGCGTLIVPTRTSGEELAAAGAA